MNKAVKWLVGGGLLLWLYNKFATATALMKTNIEVVGFRFFSIKWDYTTVDIDFQLQNLSQNRVVLNGIQFSLYLNGTFVGSSSQSLNNVVLESYQTLTVRARVSLKTSKLLSLLNAYLATNASKYHIDVSINGRLGANGTSYQFTPSFYVRIPSLVSLVEMIKNLFSSGDKVTDVAHDKDAEVTEITSTTE